MSVSLHTIASTGKECPKCDNQSVFSERKYKFLGFLFYCHTVEKCEMGEQYCDYSKIIIEK